MFTPLTLKKIQLQAHKAMCNTCNAYEAQSKLIDYIGKWFITNSTQRKAALDEDKKNKIIEEIRKI
jgi:hypothetical protein